ncbi:transcription initiation factor TFIID subunit 1 isoform X2 [Ceratitis capitata]|uniref:transcription initiation factor TFIID subunit 1 isoform X2 n=1 Tax=Ceratitis capitata TaxID=7213 RepID=UPI000329D83D|nr:transcription initiation factor TFIID subunit 1 isoform X2 [Ceratitis capitata]
MSTGRRLAKRSIIGTKVCAPGPDGLWYSGVIQDVKTPPSATVTSSSLLTASDSNTSHATNGTNLTANTKFIVRFDFKTQAMQSSADTSLSGSPSKPSIIIEARRAVSAHLSPAQALRRNAMIKEFRESDLIGPGFRSIIGIQLQPGQRVFLTFNGRETSGDVVSHDAEKDEVVVKIMTIGNEEPIELKKRLEEVRLLESRRSARLADQERDTDFARLADMGGDRRRATSLSIEVPNSISPQNNSRKRPQPYTHEFFSGQCGDKEEMEECNAALILMKLSHSPKNAEKLFGSSPGSSSSSGSSWSSGSSSPPLSDDGHAGLNTSPMLNDPSARIRTTSVSTSDEGIVVDFNEEAPRKKRTNKSKFKCTWKGCKHIEHTPKKIERHIRNVHLGNKKARRSADYDESCSENDHEEEFYYTEIEDDEEDNKTPSPTSPPTLSHRDMARPPHEDPEYQRKIVGNFKQGRINQHQQLQHNQGQQINNCKTVFHGGTYITNSNIQDNQQMQNNCVSTSPLNHHNYWQSSPVPGVTSTPTAISSVTQNSSHQHHHNPQSQQQQSQYIKHIRASPRPSQTAAPYPSPTYHHNYSSSPNSCINNNSSGNVNLNNNGCHSNNSSIMPNNGGANNMLHQLSQQNITVTAHRSGAHQNQPHQQQQLPAVTITPNYTNHQVQQQQLQEIHSQQQTSQSNISGTGPGVTVASAHVHQQHTTHHAQQQQSQHGTIANTNKLTANSPNRRTRGENKKCRKVYGMERRDQWCTQCRWKKACSRFGD